LSSMNTAWKKMDGVSSQKMSLDHYLPQLITRLLVCHNIGQIVKYTLIPTNHF